MIDRLTQVSGRSIFGANVSGYHRVRVDYPDALYAAIAARLGNGPIDTIGEIGPGTGIASAQLLQLKPRRLVGFEPDQALAAHLADTIPAMEVVASDFVSADVSGSFDLVAAAACFHWLDPLAALSKIKRMLRPGGCVAIWWNVYREDGIGDDFAQAVIPHLADVALPPSEGEAGHDSLDWKRHIAQLIDAGFVDAVFTVYRREHLLTPQMARDLYASFSFVRALDPGRREALLTAIAGIVRDDFDDAARSIILTPLYLATNPSPREG